MQQKERRIVGQNHNMHVRAYNIICVRRIIIIFNVVVFV